MIWYFCYCFEFGFSPLCSLCKMGVTDCCFYIFFKNEMPMFYIPILHPCPLTWYIVFLFLPKVFSNVSFEFFLKKTQNDLVAYNF